MKHNIYYKVNADNFEITLGKAEDVATPWDEFCKIAKLIPRDVTVLVSGGSDSEAMVKLLDKAGHHVTGVSYKFTYQGKWINKHDMEWLPDISDYCTLVEKTIDLEVFWRSKWFWAFLSSHKCTSPQLPLQAYMTMVESMERYTVLPAIHPEPKLINGVTHIQEREKDYSILNELYGQNCMISPLRHTPNMIASLLSSNEIKNFHTFGVDDGRDRKSQQYKEWFDIDVAPRQKYHGFENSEEIDNMMREKIFKAFYYSECWIFIPAEEMLKNMLIEPTTYSTKTHSSVIRNEFFKLEKW